MSEEKNIPTLIKTDDPYIALVDNVVPHEFCDELIALAEENDIDEHTGRVVNSNESGHYIDKGMRVCGDLHLVGDKFKPYREKLDKYLLEAIRLYHEGIMEIPARSEFEGFRILKYPEGGHFRPHSDARRPKDWHKRGYRLWRMLTFLLYLNDSDSGHTLMCQQEMAIPPQKGKILIFPAYDEYVHAASSVKKGDVKYAVITWLGNVKNFQFESDKGEIVKREFKCHPIEERFNIDVGDMP